MENVKITFQIIPDGKELPNWFQYINGRMVFDVKMEDSQRQAFLVAGDYMTHTPDVKCDHQRNFIHFSHYGNIT